MFRHKLTPLIYLLIVLAIFGFLFQLFTNTGSLLANLVVMVAIGAIVYGAVYYFLIRPRTPNDIKKYKKAVRQSKNKYNKEQSKSKQMVHSSKKHSPLLQKKRHTKERATHLRVIDGNKHKRKNRASF